ncbi:MAG: hypothetical protein ACRC7V_07365 [Lachnospiraceae bacterium]
MFLLLYVDLPTNFSEVNLPIQYFLVQIDHPIWIWSIRIVACVSFVTILLYYKYVKSKIEKQDLGEKDRKDK